MKRTNVILTILIVIAIAFISISYAVFNTNLFISGNGILRARAEIRVIGIENSGYTGSAIENFNPNYNVAETNASVDLPTSNSCVMYTVTIKNYGDTVYLPQIDILSEVSSNVVVTFTDGTNTYTLPEDEMEYGFAPGQEKTFTLSICNKPGTTNEDVIVSLHYHFVYDEVTAPIIAVSNDNTSVGLVTLGTSTFGVNNYEYYYNTNGSAPNENTSPLGTTSGTLTTNTINHGRFYIWYRTVSVKGTKSVWSNRAEVIKEFKITYNTKGGTVCSPSSKKASYGGTWGTLCTTTKDHYNFIEWNTNENGTGATITANSNVSEDITVYAQWELQKHTLTYNNNGGNGCTSKNNVPYGSIWGELCSPTRSGYTFVEWNTVQDGRGVTVTETTAVSGDLTVFAQWHDSTKPVCTFGTLTNPTYGDTTTVTLTCTDNDSMNSQTLNASNFTTSESTIATISNVSAPTAVTGGYEYTVTIRATGAGEFTIGLNAASVSDVAGNSNETASITATAQKKQLTASISSCNDRTYDETTTASCEIVLDGVINNDELFIPRICQVADANAESNKTVTCSMRLISDKYTLANSSATKTNAMTISKKNVAVNWDGTTEFTYDGTDQKPSATVTTGIMNETMDITITKDSIGNLTDYVARATCSRVTGGQASCNNYTLTGNSQNYTINPRPITVKATNQSKAYDETALNADNTCEITSGSLATLQNITCACTGSQTDAGNSTKTLSTVVIKTSNNENVSEHYNITKVNGTLTVNKVDAVCPSLTAYSGTYDGNSHTITVGTATGGTIQYRTSTNGTWGNTLPTRTNAGTTTVYVQVLGDNNHNTVDCGNTTIEINKYTPSITLSATSGSVNYNSTKSFNSQVNSISACLGTLTATSENANAVSIIGGSSTNITSDNLILKVPIEYKGLAYTTGTNINVNYIVSDTNNCNSATQATYSASVNRINQTVTLTEKTGIIYNGEEQEANVATTTGNGSISYTYYTNSSCTTETPTATGASVQGGAPINAGQYYVKATASQTNQYNSASSACVSHNIDKYTPSIALSVSTGTVNVNSSATFTVTPTVIETCKGTLTAVSTNTNVVSITSGASSSDVTSAKTITWRGLGYTAGTNINVNFIPNDTNNCNSAAQQQYNAKVNRLPYTATFYYNSNSSVGGTTISTIQAQCTALGEINSCTVDIPTNVKNSIGTYNNSYAGLSESVGNMTAALNQSATTVALSSDKSYYALYSSAVNIYKPTSTTTVSGTTYYRNQWFESTTAIADPVLATTSNGISNFTFTSGVSGYSLHGFSENIPTTTANVNNSTVTDIAHGSKLNYYAIVEKSKTATIYYNSGSGDGNLTITTATTGSAEQYIICQSTTEATILETEYTIPQIVTSSVGQYGNSYLGVAQLNSMTQTRSTAHDTLYAIYKGNVTNYYYDGSYQSRTIYRNSFFTSMSEMNTVLATTTTGMTNYSTSEGPGNSEWFGLAPTATTVRSYTSVDSAANSTDTTLYTIYRFTVNYQKGSNVSSIGSDVGGCSITTSTSCTVTLPSITPDKGYNSVGWSTTNGATTGTSAGSEYTINSNNITLYANAKLSEPTAALTGISNAEKVYDYSATTIQCVNARVYKSGVTFSYQFGYSTTSNGSITWIGSPSSSYSLNIAKNEYLGTRYYSCKAFVTDGNETTSKQSTAKELSLVNARIDFDVTTNGGTISGSSPLYVSYGNTSIYTTRTGATAGTIPTSSKQGFNFDGWYTTSGTKVINPNGTLVASVSGWTNENGQWILTNASNTQNTNKLLARYTLATSTAAISGGNTKVYNYQDTTLTCSNATTYGSGTNVYYQFGYSTEANGSITWLGTASTTPTISIAKDEYLGTRYYYCKTYASYGSETSTPVTSSSYTEMTLKRVKIIFDPMGGTFSGTSPLYVQYEDGNMYTSPTGTTTATISGASKVGYIFNGWYTSSSGGNQLTNIINNDLLASVSGYTNANKKWIITSVEDKTIYARFNLIPTTAAISGGTTKVYNYQDTTLTCSNTTTYGSGTTVYYDFGYSTQSNGSIIWTDGTSTSPTINIAKDAFKGTRYYYCKTWASDGSNTTTPVTSSSYTEMILQRVKLIFDANGGTLSGTSPVYVQYGSLNFYTTSTGNTTVTTPSASKTGLDFLGWYTSPTTGSKIIDSNDEIYYVPGYTTNINHIYWAFTSVSDKTIYAHYGDNTPPVVEDIEGGTTCDQSNQTVTLKCNDNVGVTKYYFGATNPTNADAISNDTQADITAITGVNGLSKTIDSTGTYYFACRDEAGNYATKNITINSYNFQNMLVKVTGNEEIHNTTNYDYDGSVTSTYLVKSSTACPVPTPNSDCAEPLLNIASYSTSISPSTVDYFLLGDTNININESATYYIWYLRENYTITAHALTNIPTLHVATQNNTTGITSTVSSNNKTISARCGEQFTATPTPDTGYEVENWTWAPTSGSNTIIGNDATVTYEPSQSGTITAVSRPKTYLITLNKADATNSPTTSVTATYNSTEITPGALTLPQKNYTVSGFGLSSSRKSDGATVSSSSTLTSAATFDGWYTATSGGSQILQANATATWNTGTVSGYLNSGKWIRDEATTLYARFGSQPSVTLPTIEKSGYTCGWTASSSGTTITYSSGASYTPSANTTLYGVCVANQYNVKLNWNLFYTYTGTSYGVTRNYNNTLQIVELNGTNTSTSFNFSRDYDISLTTGEKYIVDLKYISGSYSGSSENKLFVLDAEKDGSLISGRTYGTHYITRTLPTSGSTSRELTVTDAIAGSNSNNWRYWFWQSDANGVTFTNYKMQVLITKDTSKTVTYGSTYGTLTTPTKGGYTFDGWYTDLSGNTQVTSSSTVSKAYDHTLYAHWTPNTYTVTYNSNCPTTASGSMSSSTATFNSDFVTRQNAFTCSGYTFNGWNEAANGSGVVWALTSDGVYEKGNGTHPLTWTYRNNITLYAQWTPKTYTVTYYQGNASSTAGATAFSTTSTCTFGTACTLKTYSELGGVFPYSSADTNHTNYYWSFYGWATSTSSTTRAYTDGGSINPSTYSSNIKLYALGEHPIRFYYGQAATSSTRNTVNQYWNPYSTAASYRTTVTVPASTNISTWTFIGYKNGSNAANADVTYAASAVGTSVRPDIEITGYLRSKYSRTLTVSYNKNGGSGTMSNTTLTQYYNSGINSNDSISSNSITLASNSFTYDNHTFSKWAEGSASGTKYSAGSAYTGIGTSVTDTTVSKTMYAKWYGCASGTISGTTCYLYKQTSCSSGWTKSSVQGYKCGSSYQSSQTCTYNATATNNYKGSCYCSCTSSQQCCAPETHNITSTTSSTCPIYCIAVPSCSYTQGSGTLTRIYKCTSSSHTLSGTTCSYKGTAYYTCSKAATITN